MQKEFYRKNLLLVMKKRYLYYDEVLSKPLREDIRLLGTFLGWAIKDAEEQIHNLA